MKRILLTYCVKMLAVANLFADGPIIAGGGDSTNGLASIAYVDSSGVFYIYNDMNTYVGSLSFAVPAPANTNFNTLVIDIGGRGTNQPSGYTRVDLGMQFNNDTNVNYRSGGSYAQDSSVGAANNGDAGFGYLGTIGATNTYTIGGGAMTITIPFFNGTNLCKRVYWHGVDNRISAQLVALTGGFSWRTNAAITNITIYVTNGQAAFRVTGRYR